MCSYRRLPYRNVNFSTLEEQFAVAQEAVTGSTLARRPDMWWWRRWALTWRRGARKQHAPTRMRSRRPLVAPRRDVRC